MSDQGGIRFTRLMPLAAVAAVALVLPTVAAAVPGSISTVAGNGSVGFSGDGGASTAAGASPQGVALTADGGFLIADTTNNRIRKVTATGIISTVAGNGTNGFGGDGGPATAAQFSGPSGVAPTADGGFLIADQANSRIRRVDPAGTITTVTGDGTVGTSGDGGPATGAQLTLPVGVAATADGGFLIADDSAANIRKVSASGIITRVAGNNTNGFSGDGGLATAAQLHFPRSVAPTTDGGFLVADRGNSRIRRVSPDGSIATVAGSDFGSFSGDGGAATAASLSGPFGVAPTLDGGFLIADSGNYRIRRVEAGVSRVSPPIDRTAPRISRLSVSPDPFRARGRKAGTTLRYHLSEAATVQTTWHRNAGRRAKVGTQSQTGKSGVNLRKFSGRLKGRPLRSGSYRVTLVAIDSADNRSAPKTVRLRVSHPPSPCRPDRCARR